MNPENTKAFVELVKSHPELPIVPIVDSEVVADDGYAWWIASFGVSRVGKYVHLSMRGEDRLFTDEEMDEIEEYIADEMYDDEANEHLTAKEIDQIAHKRAEALAWTEAIIVYIGLPETV